MARRPRLIGRDVVVDRGRQSLNALDKWLERNRRWACVGSSPYIDSTLELRDPKRPSFVPRPGSRRIQPGGDLLTASFPDLDDFVSRIE